MARLATLTGTGLSMSLLTGALLPNYTLAEQVSFNDPNIRASYKTFDSLDGHGEGRGYLVQSRRREGNGPAVLVAHENRGLNPYIADVARSLAKQGYLAFAPDALYSLGGCPGNDDGKEMQRSLNRELIEQDFVAAARFLHDHELSNGKLGNECQVLPYPIGLAIRNLIRERQKLSPCPIPMIKAFSTFGLRRCWSAGCQATRRPTRRCAN